MALRPGNARSPRVNTSPSRSPGQLAPTATPVDVSKLASGTLLDYIVQPGDTLRGIALMYNSTQNAILLQNKMTDPNKLIAGEKIQIPVNIATQVPTTTNTPSTETPTKAATTPVLISATPTKAVTVTPTK